MNKEDRKYLTSQNDHDKLIQIERDMANNYRNTEKLIQDTAHDIRDLKTSVEKLSSNITTHITELDIRINKLEKFRDEYDGQSVLKDQLWRKTTTIISIISGLSGAIVLAVVQLIISHKL